MRYRWVLPLLIVIILSASMHFRWDTQAQISHSERNTSSVYKWKKDRWTNYSIISIYIAGYSKEQPYIAGSMPTEPLPEGEDEKSIMQKIRTLTIASKIVLGLSIVWLLVTFLLDFKAFKHNRKKLQTID